MTIKSAIRTNFCASSDRRALLRSLTLARVTTMVVSLGTSVTSVFSDEIKRTGGLASPSSLTTSEQSRARARLKNVDKIEQSYFYLLFGVRMGKNIYFACARLIRTHCALACCALAEWLDQKPTACGDIHVWLQKIKTPRKRTTITIDSKMIPERAR